MYKDVRKYIEYGFGIVGVNLKLITLKLRVNRVTL